jgi:NurA-like 5'-3' nuclease
MKSHEIIEFQSEIIGKQNGLIHDKDKLIEILKATIEDYRTLVVKYKESEALRDKMIENLNKQLDNQLKMINLLADGLK